MLTREQSELFLRGKKYLEKNDMDGFYEKVVLPGTDFPGHITRALYDMDVDVLQFFNKDIPDYCFYKEHLTSIPGLVKNGWLRLPANITGMGYSAFGECSGIVVFDFRNVNYIEDYTFFKYGRNGFDSEISIVFDLIPHMYIHTFAYVECPINIFYPKATRDNALLPLLEALDGHTGKMASYNGSFETGQLCAVNTIEDMVKHIK